MKIKFEDLLSAVKNVEKRSNRSDILLSFNDYNSSLQITYWTNVDTQVIINLYASELDKFATITETELLSMKK